MSLPPSSPSPPPPPQSPSVNECCHIYELHITHNPMKSLGAQIHASRLRLMVLSLLLLSSLLFGWKWFVWCTRLLRDLHPDKFFGHDRMRGIWCAKHTMTRHTLQRSRSYEYVQRITNGFSERFLVTMWRNNENYLCVHQRRQLLPKRVRVTSMRQVIPFANDHQRRW